MANIFAILTGVVLAISAFLAYQNMGDESREGRGYKGWIAKADSEESKLKTKQGELATLQADIKATQTELTDFEGQNAMLQTQLDAQLAKNTELETQVATAKREAEQKKAEADAKQQSLDDIGDVDTVLAELKQNQREIAQLDLDIAEAEAKQASLEAQIVEVDTSLGDVRERIKWRVSGKSNPDVNTRVRSVYQNLGFVTLAGGDNLGIVKDSPLEVVRDGEVIAKLQVTTVEASTSAADIVPDSLAAGESVRAGDSVRAPAEVEPAPEAAPALNPEPADAAPAAEPEPEPASPFDPVEDDDNPFG